MTYFDPNLCEAPVYGGIIEAQLLLPKPYGPDIEALSAAFLTSIGLDARSLTSAFKDPDGHKIRLQTKHGSLSITRKSTPIGAEHFNTALSPFLTAAERGAYMSVISQHEASIHLKLKAKRSICGNVSSLLHQALTPLCDQTKPLGFLWGPTGRLHQGDAMRQILSTKAPMELYLAPMLKSIGPRKVPALEFMGAPELLGFGLSLHLLNLEKQAAIRAGLAFAQHCFKDASFLSRGSFSHEGLSFRLLHNNDFISLIPVASFSKKTLSILESNEKTAA